MTKDDLSIDDEDLITFNEGNSSFRLIELLQRAEVQLGHLESYFPIRLQTLWTFGRKASHLYIVVGQLQIYAHSEPLWASNNAKGRKGNIYHYCSRLNPAEDLSARLLCRISRQRVVIPRLHK
jgi:hypothetical protein